VMSVVVVVAIGARENCCFRMSAYVRLVAVYVGLSSRRGSACEGSGSVSD